MLDEKYFTLDLVNVQGEAVLPAVTAFGLLNALDVACGMAKDRHMTPVDEEFLRKPLPATMRRCY